MVRFHRCSVCVRACVHKIILFQILGCAKLGNVLFNDALNTFYFPLYGVFLISNKGYFICPTERILHTTVLLRQWGSTGWNRKYFSGSAKNDRTLGFYGTSRSMYSWNAFRFSEEWMNECLTTPQHKLLVRKIWSVVTKTFQSFRGRI